MAKMKLRKRLPILGRLRETEVDLPIQKGTICMKAINIGSCNIDYVYAMEHFIQPGETKDCIRMTKGCGGKGLNQSIAIAQAGVEIWHAAVIGTEGQFLKDKMAEKGVNTDLVRVGQGANGHAIIQVDAGGQNSIILYGGTNRQFTEEYIDEVLVSGRPGDVVVLQNEINNIPYIIEKSYDKGLRVAFNAAPYDDTIRSYPLQKVEWLIVNEVEGAGLSDAQEPEAILAALRERYPQTKVLLTLGKEGAIYASGEEQVRVPACRVRAVDTTAAGDTFIGYFLRGIMGGMTAAEILRLATVASAIAVTRPGAADSVPAYEEVVSSELYRGWKA